MIKLSTTGLFGHHLLIARCSSESAIVNILVTTSEVDVELLPAIPASSKMIFPGDHIPLSKVVLQNAKMLADTQVKLNCLLHTYGDIMTSSSNGIAYTELIEIDMVTDPNLPTKAS